MKNKHFCEEICDFQEEFKYFQKYGKECVNCPVDTYVYTFEKRIDEKYKQQIDGLNDLIDEYQNLIKTWEDEASCVPEGLIKIERREK